MNIIKVDSFRSEGTLVNKTDDMVRVVVDLTKREYMQLPSLFATAQDTKERRKTVRAKRPVQQSNGAETQGKICPECKSTLVFPCGESPYCEECGWPDEVRPEHRENVVGP